MSTQKYIDEDGEAVFTLEGMVLDTLKKAKQLKCFTLEHGEELQVDYWNPEATNDEGIPDILIACENGTTIFFDELKDAELTDDNELIIGDYRFEIY
jgi:hypothetical protein